MSEFFICYRHPISSLREYKNKKKTKRETFGVLAKKVIDIGLQTLDSCRVCILSYTVRNQFRQRQWDLSKSLCRLKKKKEGQLVKDPKKNKKMRFIPEYSTSPQEKGVYN